MTSSMEREYGIALFPQHVELLRSSAVSPEVARERGYVSVDTKAELKRRGFKPSQQLTPALLTPLHDVFGQLAGYQARPDVPRVVDGRVVKYETPVGARMVLDVPPRVRPLLGDPKVPLLITEGPRKADAAATVGLACVAILGVWSWRGTNEDGGRLALPDWDAIALNRQVYLVFDSDVMLKWHVHEALRRLKEFLSARSATVAVIYLPSGPHGEKVGLDDYLASGGTVDDLISLASPELRPPAEPSDEHEGTPIEAFDDLSMESGDKLLDEVRAYISQFLAFPSEAYGDVLALFAAHTHAVEAFDSTPRLQLRSVEPQSGKTRTAEVIGPLCRAAVHSTNVSAPYLYRRIEEARPTIIIDEADTVFGPRASKAHEDLRGVVNAGHRRGVTVGRVVGEGSTMEPRDFDVFCPVVVAGLGRMPDTIHQRSIVLTLRRRAPHERVRPYRRRLAEPEGARLGRRLAAWAQRNLETLADTEPVLPHGIADRQADVWEPLLSIAELAGGQWPNRAHSACLEITASEGEDDATVGVRLLADLQAIFEQVGADRAFTATLLDRLNDAEESPWGAWNKGMGINARDLAHRLREYGIRPRNVRVESEQAKGYERADFEDAWSRYLATSDVAVAAVSPFVRPTVPVADAVPPESPATCEDTAGTAGTDEPLEQDAGTDARQLRLVVDL